MKRPAFQFYPADWRKDPALSTCSLAARGLWIELVCVAHESEQYGVLSINGKPMTIQQIARTVGEAPAVVTKLLEELEASGVYSKDEKGCIYSRRMVKDEYLREIRAQAGRLGGNPDLLKQNHKQKVKQPDKQSPTPSSSSSSSTSKPLPEPVVCTQPTEAPAESANTTRHGELCKRLRSLGIEAAPHLQAWGQILPAYSDLEIIGAAERAREGKPGERIHLNYLVPMLADVAKVKATGPPRNGAGKAAQRGDYLRQQGYMGGGNGDNGTCKIIIDGQAEHVD